MPRSLLAAACLAALGCATPGGPFRRGKPVDPPTVGQSGYRQDGQPVKFDELIAGLSESEPAREDAISARGWGTGGTVLASLGGFGIGYGVVSGIRGEKSGWAILGGGAAVTGAALLCARAADSHLRRAVELYNGGLGAPAKTSLVPWLAPAGTGGAVVGLAGSF